MNKHEKRKNQPIYSGVLKYFPNALLYVSEVSLAGNEQHHPDKPLHWDKSKSTDEADALVRHLLDAGKFDDDGIRHTGKVVWRALGLLQRELEKDCVIEVFEDIPGWEDFYQVSNTGKVKSFSRKWSPTESILTPVMSFDGYLKVSLKNKDKVEHVEINRLVAKTFIDKNYTEKGLVCDHIDRDKTNNNLYNLRIVSVRENTSNNGLKKLTGAFKRKNGKYQALININGRQKTIGTFNTETEAHNAYKNSLALLERELDESVEN
jgi:hypothetical protein